MLCRGGGESADLRTYCAEPTARACSSGLCASVCASERAPRRDRGLEGRRSLWAVSRGAGVGSTRHVAPLRRPRTVRTRTKQKSSSEVRGRRGVEGNEALVSVRGRRSLEGSEAVDWS